MKKSKKHPRVPESKKEEVRAPYWAHAHRDWRFLVVVFLMLAALASYIMTGGLNLGSHSQPTPVTTPAGK